MDWQSLLNAFGGQQAQQKKPDENEPAAWRKSLMASGASLAGQDPEKAVQSLYGKPQQQQSPYKLGARTKDQEQDGPWSLLLNRIS